MSMLSMREALYALLKTSGFAVYAEGQVPEGATYPYVTYDTTTAPLGEQGELRVTCWTRDDARGSLEMAKRMEEILPETGVLLRYADGLATIDPVRTELLQDAQDRRVSGCRGRFELRCYE